MKANSYTWPTTWHYDRGELIADGAIHVIGVSLGLIGAIVLLIVAARSANALQMPAIAIYCVGLLSMFGFSAAYNMWPTSRMKWILRRFDHSAIFVMIAGRYTPFLAQMAANIGSVSYFMLVWLMAIVGVAVKMLLPGRFDRVSVILCLLLGWSGIFAWEVWTALPNASLWLLATGGVLYSAGVIFHGWHSLRFQNAIWHIFVLVATGCHYWAILFCLEKAKA
jgi:hemolysin III